MTAERATKSRFPAHPVKSIRLQNILSFGPDGMELELRPLNVLIGANTAGKSNFLAGLRLLTAAAFDLMPVLRRGGGTGEWIWKGAHSTGVASVETVVKSLHDAAPLRYILRFAEREQVFALVEERLSDAAPGTGAGREYFHITEHRREIYVQNPGERVRREVQLGTNFEPGKPLIAQRGDPEVYPEIAYFGALLRSWHLFRYAQLGPNANIRHPQQTDLPGDFLTEEAENLALVLNDFDHRGLKPVILKLLNGIGDRFDDMTVKVEGGTVQLFLHERGLRSPVSSRRLSDGTLRYLCLIAILCHPVPPPLVCIEEPELGLHPDALPAVAEMLVDASSRCQLIVTTHSPELVDALSDTPESVVVCERTEAGTQMNRLDPKPLKKWIDEYRLGGAWKTGVIGGRR